MGFTHIVLDYEAIYIVGQNNHCYINHRIFNNFKLLEKCHYDRKNDCYNNKKKTIIIQTVALLHNNTQIKK